MPYVRGESLRERLRREGMSPDRRGAPDHAPGRAGAELRPQGGRGPSRREAGEPAVDRGRHHPGRRLRDRARGRESERSSGSPRSAWRSAPRPTWHRSSPRATAWWTRGPTSTHWPRPATRCLRARRPSPASSSHDLIVRRFTTPAPKVRTSRPEVSPEVEEVLHRALALRPGDRFASIAEFGTALGGGHFTTDPIPIAPGAVMGGNRALWIAAAAAALLAGGFLYTRATDPNGTAAAADIGTASSHTRLACCPSRTWATPPTLLRRRHRGRGPWEAGGGLRPGGDRRSSSSRYRGEEKSPGDRRGSRRAVPADRHGSMGEAAGRGIAGACEPRAGRRAHRDDAVAESF